MRLRTISAAAVLSSLVLVTSNAFAQDSDAAAPPPGDAAPAPPPPPSEPPDGARFRGGVSLEGGALIVPDAINVGLAGVQAQLGVQINHLIGLYAIPQFDVVFGEVGGVHLAAALVVDFSIIDEISIGVGPEVGVFGAIGIDSTSATSAGGAMYGARLRAGFQPVWGFGEDGIRRKALTIGLDVRMLAGEAGFARVSTTTAEAAASQFVFSPMLSIGYQAF